MIHWIPPGKIETKKRLPPQPTKIPARLLTFLRYARKRTRQYVIEVEGQPVGDVKTGLNGAATRAGIQRPIPDNVHAHTLRHTCITWLLLGRPARGAQPAVPAESPWRICKYVGISLKMIEDNYGHLITANFQGMHEPAEARRRVGGGGR